VSPERYPVLWIGQTAVLTLPPEIDVTNADALREDMLSLLNQGASALIADMSTTTFCDSAGVSALVRAYKRATASSADVRLVITSPAVERVLTLIGVGHFINRYPTVAAAMAGLDAEAAATPGLEPGESKSAPAPSPLASPANGSDASPYRHGEQHGGAVRTNGDGDVVADPL